MRDTGLGRPSATAGLKAPVFFLYVKWDGGVQFGVLKDPFFFTSNFPIGSLVKTLNEGFKGCE